MVGGGSGQGRGEGRVVFLARALHSVSTEVLLHSRFGGCKKTQRNGLHWGSGCGWEFGFQ